MMNSAYLKLGIALLLDIIDFTIGRILGFGTVMDVVFVLVGFVMFGWKGLFQLWEVLEVSDQVDGFVPTLTLIALTELREDKQEKTKQKRITNSK